MDASDLVKRFMDQRDSILGFILALTMNYEVAEEVFQNVAVSVLKEGSRPDVTDFQAWVRQIARHRVADHYRQQARRANRERPSGAMEEIIGQAFAEHEIAPHVNHARMKSLLDCLQRLAGRSRQVIEGFYRERKSLRVLAADLGWQENSVKVALSRARKALADCVEVRLQGHQA
jgi:RNA polymerase sigma-70 factor (ECF subfamily)